MLLLLGIQTGAQGREEDGNNMEGWKGKDYKGSERSQRPLGWSLEFSLNALFCKGSRGQAGKLPKLQLLFTGSISLSTFMIQ